MSWFSIEVCISKKCTKRKRHKKDFRRRFFVDQQTKIEKEQESQAALKLGDV